MVVIAEARPGLSELPVSKVSGSGSSAYVTGGGASPVSERDLMSDRTSDRGSDKTSEIGGVLTLGFKAPNQSGLLEVKIHFRPLGINFGKKVPVTVKSVEAKSGGSSANVQPGWQLMQINHVDVSQQEFGDIVTLLKDATKPLKVVGGARSKSSSQSGSPRKMVR